LGYLDQTGQVDQANRTRWHCDRANGTITVAGQRLRIGRSHQGRTVANAIDDTVFRVFIDGNEICTHARRTDTDVAIFKAYPRRPST
jgi:hypothetical protein